MTRKQVAELFGRTPRTISNWARAGAIPCRWFFGRLLFLRTDIEDIVEVLKKAEGKAVILHGPRDEDPAPGSGPDLDDASPPDPDGTLTEP